jgi:hypothetical protein
LKELIERAHSVVLGWGKHGAYLGRDREVMALVTDSGKPLYCIKQNLDGSPVHPLYQRDDSKFVVFKEGSGR